MESPLAPAQPNRIKITWLYTLVPLLIVLGVAYWQAITWIKRPQFDLTNTGTNSVTIVFGKQVDDVPPGNTWHARFDTGDQFTFRPPAAAPDAGLTVKLEKPVIKDGKPPRVTAEVNADVPTQISFKYR